MQDDLGRKTSFAFCTGITLRGGTLCLPLSLSLRAADRQIETFDDGGDCDRRIWKDLKSQEGPIEEKHMIIWFQVKSLQGLAKKLQPGLVNSVGTVAYHFCMSLPAAFKQPGQSLLASPSRSLDTSQNTQHY